MFLSTDRIGRNIKTAAVTTGCRLALAIFVCTMVDGIAVAGSANSFSEAESSDLVAADRPASVIRENVAIACGTTDVRHQVERSRAAANLGSGFNAEEVNLMLKFLDEKFAGQSEYNSLELNAIKNELSWALLHQDKPVESYCNALIAMYRNPAHDYVWRDYCIQHMAIYCSQLGDHSGASKNAALYGVRACLDDATKNITKPICGTALIGMLNLLGIDGVHGALNVSDTALQIAKNAKACNSARASAIQVAMELKAEGVLEVARELAQSGGDALLLTSAACAIGRMGSVSDVTLLEKLSRHSDSRISLSARRAVKLLKARIKIDGDRV